jgi:hypothetical protein
VAIGNPSTFHALPLDAKAPPATTTVLYESTARDGPPVYFTDEARLALEPGRPVARVWRNPSRLVLPPG